MRVFYLMQRKNLCKKQNVQSKCTVRNVRKLRKLSLIYLNLVNLKTGKDFNKRDFKAF